MFRTLQCSVVYDSSLPLFLPPPSKHLHSPLAPSLNSPTPACVSGKADVALPQGFVQELIRRSRTSGTVLQTALTYIEAVRQKLAKATSPPVALAKETTPEESSLANWLSQNRSSRHHLSIPTVPFSHPLS